MDIYGYTVNVDEPATRNWYDRAEDWDCPCVRCRNFLALARQRRLPAEILEILDDFSIPPEKATYVCELYYEEDWREKGLLYELCWRLPGEVLDKPAGKDAGRDWGPGVEFPWGSFALGHECAPCGEAENLPEPSFDLICTLYLPWVLDEPIEGPGEE